MRSDFLDIIQENEGIIYKIVKIYALQKDDQLDLYQEIVYQLWRSCDLFEQKSKISTWIYRVALNTALAQVHSRNKRKGISADADLIVEVEDKVGKDDQDQIAKLYHHIRNLNEVDRAIIFLVLESKNYDEIAAITGFTVSNVSTRVHRIKIKLKDKITKS